MDIATQEPTKPAEERNPASAARVKPIDPEHDIDAKKTVTWLTAALVFVVLALLVLAKAFDFSVRGQQHEKIETLPARELRQLRSDEDYLLKKATPAGESDRRSLAEINDSIRQTTDQIIDRYVGR